MNTQAATKAARQFEKNRTTPGGVLTQNGLIPYLRHPKLGFNMPIMVMPSTKDDRGLCRPRIIEGVAMWAMPGGYIFVSDEPVAYSEVSESRAAPRHLLAAIA